MRNLLLLLTLGWLSVCRGQGVPREERFAKVNAWMEDNVRAMGGHAFLVVEKGGKIVYAKGVHGLRGPYNLQSRERIASSSKWLSAAREMELVRLVDAAL